MTKHQAKLIGKTLVSIYGGKYGKYRDSRSYSVWHMVDGLLYWVDDLDQYWRLMKDFSNA